MRTVTNSLLLAAACALVVSPAYAQKAPSSGDTSSTTQSSKPSMNKDSSTTGSTSQSTPSTNTQPGSEKAAPSSRMPTQLGSDKDTTHSSRTGQGSEKAMDHSNMPGMAQNSDQVKQAQEALKAKGQDPGPVDGIIGPNTARAIRAYQKQQQIASTGKLDQQTLESLGVSGTSK